MSYQQRSHLQDVHEERQLAHRMRDAIGFCKQELHIKAVTDFALK